MYIKRNNVSDFSPYIETLQKNKMLAVSWKHFYIKKNENYSR